MAPNKPKVMMLAAKKSAKKSAPKKKAAKKGSGRTWGDAYEPRERRPPEGFVPPELPVGLKPPKTK